MAMSLLCATLTCVAAYTRSDQIGSALLDVEAAALAADGNGEACDPTWCNCKDDHCAAHAEDEGCDLCSQKFLFVLSAGGRTGSTSILEGLNSLPGVSLSGENMGLLQDLRTEYDKTNAVKNSQSKAEYSLPDPQGLQEHTLCRQQSTVVRLAGETIASGDLIYGFKELLQLPSFDKGGAYESEFPHLPAGPSVCHRSPLRPLRLSCMGSFPVIDAPRPARLLRPGPPCKPISVSDALLQAREKWIKYLDTLFPCSRIVLNLRHNRKAQAKGVLESFFNTSDPKSVPPLKLLETELEMVSQFMLDWHQNMTSTGRSFLMYTEDMTAERFTELAEWLGQPCTFDSAPHANEFDPQDPMPYFHDSDEPANVSCSDPKTRQVGSKAGTGVELKSAAYAASDQAGSALLDAEAAAFAADGNGEACDPTWCNCKDDHCAAHDEDEGCDLCSQKFLFVLSAGGRTGSTSVLEGLNSLPGVSLSGENMGLLRDLRAQYVKLDELSVLNERRSKAAYFVPHWEGLQEHTLCRQQSTVARWARPQASGDNKSKQIYGFMELLQLPSLDIGGAYESKFPHLPARPSVCHHSLLSPPCYVYLASGLLTPLAQPSPSSPPCPPCASPFPFRTPCCRRVRSGSSIWTRTSPAHGSC